jgi:hypothetical protein
VRCIAARQGPERRLEQVVELPAVRQSGQRVLHSQPAGLAFRLDAARHLPPLRGQKAPSHDEQTQAQQRGQSERLVELDHLFLGRYPGHVRKNVDLVGDQRGDAHERQQNESVPGGHPMTAHRIDQM